MFSQVMWVLRLAELLFLAVMIVLALLRSEYVFGGVALIASFVSPHLVRRRAYNRELQRMAKLQVEKNRMEWREALEVAKVMLDMQVRDGWRAR